MPFTLTPRSLPLYFSSYVYKNKQYCFFVHGQTGKYDGIWDWSDRVSTFLGTRPFGFSSIVKGLKSIGNFFRSKPTGKTYSPTGRAHAWTASIEIGSSLAAQDNYDRYIPDALYIVLPPSDTQLGITSVGFVTIANLTEQPLLLEAHRRSSTEAAGSYLLPARCQQSFDFVGSWLIMLVDCYDAGSVKVSEVSTTNGGTKGNLLEMMWYVLLSI